MIIRSADLLTILIYTFVWWHIINRVIHGWKNNKVGSLLVYCLVLLGLFLMGVFINRRVDINLLIGFASALLIRVGDHLERKE
jgi:hypothetical protein